MSTGEDLQRDVRRILGQAKIGDRIYRHSEQELAAERRRLEKNPHDDPALDFDDSTVVNEQVVLLKLLHDPRASGEEFVRILAEQTTATNAAVVTHALVELGKLDAVLHILGRLRTKEELSLLAAIWGALGEKLRREAYRFTDPALDVIDAWRGIEEQWLRDNWNLFSEGAVI